MELMPRKEVSKPGEINEKLAIESEIRFYRANEKPYGTFSNLYPRTVEFDGEVFLTAEHAYQAGKAYTVASLLCSLHETYTGRVSRASTPLELISNPTLAGVSDFVGGQKSGHH